MGSLERRVQQAGHLKTGRVLETPQKRARRVFSFEICCIVKPVPGPSHPKPTRG